MKKYIMTVVLLVMVTIISGCAVNADATPQITYPKLNELTDTDEEPYRFEIETVTEPLEEPGIEEREASYVVDGGAEWIYAKTQDGTTGTKTTKYKTIYNKKDELLSRVEIPDAVEIADTTPTVYEGGQKAQVDAYYRASRITRYGVDCNGCNMGANGRGSTALGIGVGLDEVRQSDGTWKKGLTYDGYYIIATSAAIPFGTIVEISNHTVSGAGITPGVPFQAIVADRGGAITGSKIDLYAGSEHNMLMSQGGMQSADVRIVGMNGI
ncbi:3D domain-containing protein [Erysipelothrix aquatica]|uniref:3D domain-containing protein n=1 Tax=Erysipelothrix aquatica TaxID=2683714 RepID=UPI001356DB78|nr:3D domain-containing protein [Erysipelothrix aquatica]